MVSIVIVSQSPKIAAAVADLARETAKVPIEIAFCQTDRNEILAAIRSVYSDDGVGILGDVSDAIFNSREAIELLETEKKDKVKLCSASLVEGAIAVALAISSGANLDGVVASAEAAMVVKNSLITEEVIQNKLTVESKISLNLIADLINLAREFRAKITLANLNNNFVNVDLKSIDRLISLGIKKGDEIIISATGVDGKEALIALGELLTRKELIIGSLQKEKEPIIEAIPAVGGVAIGSAIFYRPLLPEISNQKTKNPGIEWENLREAIDYIKAEIDLITTEYNRDILGIYLLFLEDRNWLERVKGLIFQAEYTAANAWKTIIEESLANYEKDIDPYLENLITNIGIKVLRLLEPESRTTLELSEPGILFAYDLSPSETIDLRSDRILGICLAAGSILSKTTKIIESKGIPMVVGLGEKLWQIPANIEIVLDGYTGQITTAANEEQLEEFNLKQNIQNKQNEWGLEPTTQDGYTIPLMSNIVGVEDAKRSVELGAEGIGLFRSEYLFLDCLKYPEETEQLAIYQAISKVLENRPLTILTIDLVNSKERNSLLGWRGIRQALDSPNIFKTQLRAILKASAEANIRILLPMVSSIQEIQAAKEIIAEVKQDLQAAKIDFAETIPIGMMVESPAATINIDRLATQVDFLTIDTNNLAQYIMAADRTNFRVAHLADPFEPAVLRAIQKVIIASRVRGIRVSVCGQMAADSLGIYVLLGLGVDELIFNGESFLKVIKYITGVNLEAAEAIVKDLLVLESAIAVKKYVFNRLSIM